MPLNFASACNPCITEVIHLVDTCLAGVLREVGTVNRFSTGGITVDVLSTDG